MKLKKRRLILSPIQLTLCGCTALECVFLVRYYQRGGENYVPIAINRRLKGKGLTFIDDNDLGNHIEGESFVIEIVDNGHSKLVLRDTSENITMSMYCDGEAEFNSIYVIPEMDNVYQITPTSIVDYKSVKIDYHIDSEHTYLSHSDSKCDYSINKVIDYKNDNMTNYTNIPDFWDEIEE